MWCYVHEEFLHSTDTYPYRAKAEGRNRVTSGNQVSPE